MSVPRGSCGGALLPDGINILIVGGTQGGMSVHSTSEIFNTETGVFRSGPRLISGPRAGHAVVLYQGRAVAMGGTDCNTSLNTCEQYDPLSNTWSLFVARAGLGAAVVRGKIYVVGV